MTGRRTVAPDAPWTTMRVVRFAALQFLVIGLVVLAILVSLQRRIIYPLAYETARATPAAFHEYRSARIDTPSGRLLIWHAPGRPDRPTALFLHGNATGIDGIAYVMKPFRDAGWQVVAPEFPGYPGNVGRPTEEGLRDAARAGWRYIMDTGTRPQDVVVVGNSIGSGAAIAIAGERRPRGLAVVSGIASMPQVVRNRIPLIPDFLVFDRYYNAKAMRRVRGRVVVVHGAMDDLVPVAQGKALAAAAGIRPTIVQGGHEIIASRTVVDMIRRTFDATP